jgi:hypothetical protein
MRVLKSQIRKFLLLISKSQLHKFLQNTAQLCLQTVLKVAFLRDFSYVQILIGSLNALFVREKKYLFAELRKF